jgi:hypothetical protein
LFANSAIGLRRNVAGYTQRSYHTLKLRRGCSVHKGMKTSGCVAVVLSTVVTLLPMVWAAEPPAKPEARDPSRTEDRMKDEKRRDEQAARSYAGNVKVARFDSVWRAPRTQDIDVYQAGEQVPHGGKRAIALMSFECEIQDETHAVAGFIVKAKDLGADGVVLLPLELPSAGQVIVNIPSPRDRRVFRAHAIVYR